MYVMKRKGGKTVIKKKAGGKMKHVFSKMSVIIFSLVMITNISLLIDEADGTSGDSNLVAHWSFDEGIGSIAYDSTGSNDATIHGANWVDGISAKALSFDGINDYIEVVNTEESFDFSSKSFSWELWINIDSLDGNQPVILQGAQSSNHGLHIVYRGDGRYAFAFWSNDLNVDSYYDHNTWHYWAGTYNANTNERKMYRDGELVGEDVATSDYQGTGSLYIGGGASVWPTEFFSGKVDEMCIYSDVLSDSEVKQNYEKYSKNERPTVTILSPDTSSVVINTISISGVASDTDGTIQSVQIRIDSGSWMTATGTSSWSYSWDTTTSSDGSHTVYARSYDGEDYSDISSIIVTINNEIENGLVGYWSFDEGTGTILHDTAGAVHDDGTIHGAEWTTGVKGYALDFDGELDDHVLIPDSDDLDLTDDFTIEFWFYPRAMGRTGGYYAQQELLCKHKAFLNGDGSWTIENSGPGKKINFDYQAIEGFPTNQDFVDHTWYHIAITYDDTSNMFSVYVNGTLDKQGIRNMNYQDTDLDLYFGIEHYNPYVNPFDGLLDEVRFYKRELSASEVQDNYNALSSGNQKPVVSITSPSDGNSVSDSVTVTGTASDSDGSVQRVEFRINTASWITISGTSSWSYVLNTASLTDGVHTLSVRSYDGETYSDISSIDVNINNQGSAGLYSPDDPVAYWSFDTGSGSIANDESVNNNDGVINGATWVNGKRDYALDFDGTDDYVLVSDSDFLDLTGDFTIEMWIYPHDVGRGEADVWEYNQQWLLCKHKAFTNGDGSWGIFNALERDDFHWDYQGEDATDGVTDIQNNEWTHLAYTYDDTQNIFTIYVNGDIDTQATKDYGIQNTNHDLFFGCESKGSTIWHTYDGYLDEIVIYDRILEPSEFWGLTFEPTDPVEKSTPGFTSTIAIATIVMTGALVAFFRRRN